MIYKNLTLIVLMMIIPLIQMLNLSFLKWKNSQIALMAMFYMYRNKYYYILQS